MITKTFEIRDKATFIPVLAIKLRPGCEPDRYLLARAGFGRSSAQQDEYVMVVKIDGGDGKAVTDVYDWSGVSRTMRVAHDYIIKHFNELNSGEVVCVEYILSERDTPKISERLEDPIYGT